MLDAVPVAGDVILHIGGGQGAHGQADLAHMPPDRLALGIEDDGGEECVGATAERLKLGESVSGRGWFGEGLAVEGEDLIATDDEGAGVPIGDAARLGLGQSIGDVAGAGTLGGQAVADGSFVNPGQDDIEAEARIAQQLGADRGTGGEEEGFGELIGHGCV